MSGRSGFALNSQKISAISHTLISQSTANCAAAIYRPFAVVQPSTAMLQSGPKKGAFGAPARSGFQRSHTHQAKSKFNHTKSANLKGCRICRTRPCSLGGLPEVGRAKELIFFDKRYQSSWIANVWTQCLCSLIQKYSSD